MSKHPFTMTISASLDTSERPEEARAWNLLADRVRALLEEARRDPQFAAIATDIDPVLAFEADPAYE
ncbi:hypothetical protein [Actinomadura nitritigenes]|uniref:hypothetical protein n=1 Tax=Actinomadura nitritigenes TaxID=134602 RepID=UPI003D93D84D